MPGQRCSILSASGALLLVFICSFKYLSLANLTLFDTWVLFKIFGLVILIIHLPYVRLEKMIFKINEC